MLVNGYLKLGFYGLLVFCVGPHPLWAKDWLFSPTVNTGMIYTDNVNLKKDKQSAFVLETSPGIAVSRNTENVRLGLNYKLQNLFNASSSQNNLYHIFNFNSSLQVVNNSLFLDTRASNTQQNSSSSVTSNSNISGINRTNVTSYGFSPSWTPHFNGYAVGNIRFNYDEIKTDNSAISDTTQTGQSVNITSDKRFSNKLSWRITHANSEQQRNNSSSVKLQNSEAETRLKISKNVSFISLLGYSDNQYQTTSSSFKNGAYYTLGALWKPSRQFSIEAGYGNNSYVTLAVSPFRRLNWETTFRHKEIGTNLGDIWQSNFSYQAKRTNVTVGYLEDTVTSQSTLLSQAATTLGQTASATQYAPPINNAVASLSNSVYIRKRANATIAFNTGKSIFSANVYDERRLFQDTGRKEDLTGITASWTWQFAHSMNVYVSPLLQHTTRYNTVDIRKDIAIGVSKVIPVKFSRAGGMNAVLEYRHSNQKSDLVENTFDENRLTANLLIAF